MYKERHVQRRKRRIHTPMNDEIKHVGSEGARQLTAWTEKDEREKKEKTG